MYLKVTFVVVHCLLWPFTEWNLNFFVSYVYVAFYALFVAMFKHFVGEL